MEPAQKEGEEMSKLRCPECGEFELYFPEKSTLYYKCRKCGHTGPRWFPIANTRAEAPGDTR